MTLFPRKSWRLIAPLGVSLTLLLTVPPSHAEPQAKTIQLTGKVVPLAGLLEKFGSHLDPEAAPHWLTLVTDDKQVYPLIRDDGARMFFKDARLLDRPMRLTGKLYSGTHLLQVLTVQSLIKGELHDVYYWCDICSIKRFEKKACECCGGPMELREVAVKK